jgi:hypothetical protein
MPYCGQSIWPSCCHGCGLVFIFGYRFRAMGLTLSHRKGVNVCYLCTMVYDPIWLSVDMVFNNGSTLNYIAGCSDSPRRAH